MISIATLVIISTNNPITLIVMIIASLSEVMDEREEYQLRIILQMFKNYLIYIPLFEAEVGSVETDVDGSLTVLATHINRKKEKYAIS